MANMRLDLTEEEFILYYRYAAEKAEKEPVMRALYEKLEGKSRK